MQIHSFPLVKLRLDVLKIDFFFPTEMMHLIHPNEVVKSLRQFVQDNRQPQK